MYILIFRSKSHIQKTPDRFEERLRRRMEGIYSDEEQDVGVSNSSSDIVSSIFFNKIKLL